MFKTSAWCWGAAWACFLCLESSAFGCDYSLTQKIFDFRGHPIAYEVAERSTKAGASESGRKTLGEKRVNEMGSGFGGIGGANGGARGGSSVQIDTNERNNNVDEEPLLLLNGFGVGSFHQHRLIPQLLSNNDGQSSRSVYCMDYLGQGKSWPSDCNDGSSPTEQGLRYCIYTWSEQIIQFIEGVILPAHPNIKKVHLCGNSVGGHLSVVVALQRPDIVSSITLLNATPVWGLNLPFWSGHLPAPGIPKWIGRKLFDWIRDEKTIEKYLEAAYSRRAAFDDQLIQDIRQCTEISKGGHAAFSSILWSPPAKFPDLGVSDFSGMLEKLHCDVLLLFGRDDPWCTPAFGRNMVRKLSARATVMSSTVNTSQSEWSRHSHRYIELDNVGHCPNHESPQAVAKVLSRWLSSAEGNRDKNSLTLIRNDEDAVTIEPWGSVRLHEVDESELQTTPSLVDRLVLRMVG